MAESNEGLMKEFEEFLAAKRESESKAKEQEDFDIEIWDEKGRGVRTKRSHAKPFLQTLGLDIDEEKSEEKDEEKDEKTTTRKSTGKQSSNATSASITKKYFTGGKK